ncbi:MAG: ecdysteroid 22-kinase family protein [Chitinispirillales bacterium]|jgi:thiamine kinase-like enzyme|nr:ecdysteroid 22-kinase family protein [Chitinispirillales bacterium]
MNKIINKTITKQEHIQSLWGGYGELLRCYFQDIPNSVVVKRIQIPSVKILRGKAEIFSHERKLRSYQVELFWYQNYADLCNEFCRVPILIESDTQKNEIYFVLEDLNAAGYLLRKRSLQLEEAKSCLKWLANFHALFLGKKPQGLWKTGTYWHLKTRPFELENLKEKDWISAAPLIDKALSQAEFLTFVHGDAKLSNFCFSPNGAAAAVDFQYVGGGVGVKDVAYFLDSCFTEDFIQQNESKLLDFYFNMLKNVLCKLHPQVDTDAIEREWRRLYDFAWVDFYRFLKGWTFESSRISDYTKNLTKKVFSQI